MNRAAWRATTHGVSKSQTQLARSHFFFSRRCVPFPRKCCLSWQCPLAADNELLGSFQSISPSTTSQHSANPTPFQQISLSKCLGMLQSTANVASVPFGNSAEVKTSFYPSKSFGCPRAGNLTVACKPLAWVCLCKQFKAVDYVSGMLLPRHKREISMFSINNTCGSYCLTEIGPCLYFILFF